MSLSEKREDNFKKSKKIKTTTPVVAKVEETTKVDKVSKNPKKTKEITTDDKADKVTKASKTNETSAAENNSKSEKTMISENDNNNATEPRAQLRGPRVSNKKVTVWMDLKAETVSLGRIVIELYQDVPLAAENFRALCTGEVLDPETGENLTYAGTTINLAMKERYIMGGDIVDPEGQGDMSIYGGPFEDEKAGLLRKHLEPGTVSMFSTESNLNDSKFMITLHKNMSWLDGRHVVVGKVIQNMKALYKVPSYANEEGLPECNIYIADCGRVKKPKKNFNKKDENEKGDENEEGDDNNEDNDDEDSEDEDDNEEKPLCTKCESDTSYIRRVVGRGIFLKCKNTHCRHSFYTEDKKLTPEQAQLLLGERQEKHKKLIEERKNQKKMEYESRQAKKELIKKSRAEAKAKGEKWVKPSQEFWEDDEEPLPNAYVAGPHLRESILASYEESQQIRENVKSLQSAKRVEAAIKRQETREKTQNNLISILKIPGLDQQHTPKDADNNKEKKPYEKKSFEKKPFEKKPFEKKPFEKKPFEKKPFEKRSDGNNRPEKRSFDNAFSKDVDSKSNDKPFTKKSFDRKTLDGKKSGNKSDKPKHRTTKEAAPQKEKKRWRNLDEQTQKSLYEKQESKRRKVE